MLEHAAPTERHMTEEEFVAWCDEDTNAEWADGVVIVKEPVSGEHDQIAWWLRTLLQHYVEHRDRGLVSGPQFSVRLPRRPSRRERVLDRRPALAHPRGVRLGGWALHADPGLRGVHRVHGRSRLVCPAGV